LILVPGDHPPILSAIVQKEQLGKITWDADLQTHLIQRRMPERIPEATFAEIRRYLSEGDYANMTEDEHTRGAETAPFSDKLSKEQLSYISAEIALETARASTRGQSSGLLAQTKEKQSAASGTSDRDTAVKMFQSGISVEQISEVVGAPPVLVERWIAEKEAQ